MTRFSAILLLLGLFVPKMDAQVKIVKPLAKPKPTHTRMSVYGGLTNSVLLLERNIKEDNSALGFHGGITYGITRVVRASVEYTRYREINIAPTWFDIYANTIEVNMHTIARMQNVKAYFYPIFGVSYNVFGGYFTGQNDYLNLSRVYDRNIQVQTRWFGLNVGTGLEFIVKPFSIFGEFKMRIGKSDSQGTQLNIMDVCFSSGVRYNFRVPSVHKIFKGTRSRYLLNSAPADDDF